MPQRSFALRRHAHEVAELHLLESLTEEVDPADAARMVAEASAANLPQGNKTAARFLADPVRSFAVTEARAGTIDGVWATFVRIGPKAGGDSEGGRGSASETTFAFAELPRHVAWTEVWPRPQWVPVSPDLAVGHPDFDARYMVACDDPDRTLTPPVVARFLATPDETFSWASIWDDRVCAHGIHGPAGHADDERLVEFAVSLSAAMSDQE